MLAKKYESSQLISVLESLFKQQGNGILSLKTQVTSWQYQRSCLLMLYNGALVYGDTELSYVPSNQELCKMLGEKLNPNLINAALSVATERINNPKSVRELIENLIKMRVFTWEQVETFITTKIVLILERFLSYPGEAQWQASNNFDLSYGTDNHGLNWSFIQQQLTQRQQIWQGFAPAIPSMDAIPIVSEQQLQKIDNSQVKDHFRNSVDGKQNLIDIAEKMDKDPLTVAKSYLNWVNNGWVSWRKSEVGQARIQAQENQNLEVNTPKNISQPQNNQNLPIVLSVDDSPIIQTTIKRALQEHYQVLLADKAVDALEILNQQPVKLLLLDLTMPDVDGLEFCQQIRKMPKFHDLPIIMVTARDGLVNKMKGHIAGTSKYLTKPFQPEELREVVSQYIKK
jgi:CheY-like chemotaxis protein